MYSLRDVTKDDLKGSLRAVADMGYKTVEFAGFFGHPAETVKAWLDEYGLKAVGTHTGYGALDDDFDATVAYHKVIGCKNLIIPWGPMKTPEEIDAFVEKINKWLPALKAEGIELHYHNHAGEFKPVADGIIPTVELAKRTDIMFEVDTYWAYVAGEEPVEVLKKYADRIKMIHLKDGFADGHGVSLGQGTAPVNKAVEYALAKGLDIVVESEGCDPTGKEEVERCIEFLKSLE